MWCVESGYTNQTRGSGACRHHPSSGLREPSQGCPPLAYAAPLVPTRWFREHYEDRAHQAVLTRTRLPHRPIPSWVPKVRKYLVIPRHGDRALP